MKQEQSKRIQTSVLNAAEKRVSCGWHSGNHDG